MPDIIDSGVDIGLKAHEFFSAIAAPQLTLVDPVTGDPLAPAQPIIPEKPILTVVEEPVDSSTTSVTTDTPPSSGATTDTPTGTTNVNNTTVEVPAVSIITAGNIFGDKLTEMEPVVPGVLDQGTLAPPSGGGGGGDIFDQPKVASDGGYVQTVSGITVTGWVYPYPFLAITALGGGLGYYVAKRFKQPLVAMLALIAAGLMAGSAIGMKVKPPVKKV
jgi:hypothetical protein